MGQNEHALAQTDASLAGVVHTSARTHGHTEVLKWGSNFLPANWLCVITAVKKGKKATLASVIMVE